MPKCTGKNRRCRKCGRKYPKSEIELWECPECGENRKCTQNAITGTTKCKQHGGKSLKGISSPSLKTGKYSKFLPDKLAARYQEIMDDNELLTLKNEVHLIDTRLTEILENIQNDDTKTLWIDLQSSFERYKNAYNDERRSIELNNLEQIIETGSKVYHQWNEIYLVLEQRRKLVESERKRYLEMQQMISSDRLMLLVSTLLGVIKENVKDRETLNIISTEFRRLTS